MGKKRDDVLTIRRRTFQKPPNIETSAHPPQTIAIIILYVMSSRRQVTTDTKVLSLTVVSSITTTMIYNARYCCEIGRRRFCSFFISIAADKIIYYSGFIGRLYEYYYIDGVGRNSDSIRKTILIVDTLTSI